MTIAFAASGSASWPTRDPARPFPGTAVSAVLQRRPGDEPAEWSLVHAGTAAAPGRRAPRAEMPYVVAIAVPAGRLGWIRALRRAPAAAPSVEETRLLAAAADQIGRGLERDRLAEEATTAEIARRSDELKSALLDSVSHELRTPLAAIRAAAGTLADPDVEWPAAEVRASAASIDREAERLAQLVGNLLDVGRIEGGALHPVRSPFVLADLVHDAVERSRALLGDRPVTTDIPDDLPAVLVDAVHLELILREHPRERGALHARRCSGAHRRAGRRRHRDDACRGWRGRRARRGLAASVRASSTGCRAPTRRRVGVPASA